MADRRPRLRGKSRSRRQRGGLLVPLTDRIDAKRVYLFGVCCTTIAHLAFGLLADGFWSAMVLRLAGRHSVPTEQFCHPERSEGSHAGCKRR
jgi:hypothetical protein